MAEKNIVIMGGSFNPPTIAHLRTLQAAVDAVGAEKGFFVPVSHAYLKRKMRRSGIGHLCLSDELRIKMLEAMCEEDERLAVSDLELSEVKASTYPTMCTFAEWYPQAKCYFVAGADKLKLLNLLGERSDFLERFGVVLFCRDGIDVEKEILKRRALWKNRESFVLADQPEGIEQISSTVIRERMLSGESLEGYVHPAAEELLRSVNIQDFPEEIDQFKEDYEFLSNRYPAPIKWRGRTYGTADAAFRAFRDAQEKNGAQEVQERQTEYLYIMEEIVRCKFEQHPDLVEKLLETEGKVLIAGNKRKDTFWGVKLYSWMGENHLGKILMKIRTEKRYEREG